MAQTPSTPASASSSATSPQLQAMDGMTAAAQAAYALSDAAFIYPITPASRMAETVERWACDGRLNFFGSPVEVKEMQSEKGVAGALHGALAGGALTSTFTASQGLMLMIPNLYKLSGELLPGVLHVTCRSLSAHALSIFGDHQDIMAIRATGLAMLASATVQECMDLSWVAHLSAIDGSVPFVHFFDGFRTSDAIETIETIDPEAMKPLVDWDKVRAFRQRCLEPERPQVRGTAQNPDIYFQNREAANPYYDKLPALVQANMDKLAKLSGRQYHLFDYTGAPDATHVIVTMASSAQVVAQTVAQLQHEGHKVGVVAVRLYRPFSAAHLMDALPQTVQCISVLDRTKEPGSLGEPLFEDVALAVLSSGRAIKVFGGRYGLSSKDFTPAQVKAVFDNMDSSSPKERFSVGITDDVTYLSLPVGEPFQVGKAPKSQAVFYGFGSDGTVGASKQAARILSQEQGAYVQEYSWFDSKKSGGLTICYLRLDDAPIQAPYLIDHADYVACHKSIYVRRGYPMASRLKEGGTFVINAPWATPQDWERQVPSELRRALAKKHAKLYAVDATSLAEKCGLGGKVNLIMECVYLKLSGLMDYDRFLDALKKDIARVYAAKGSKVVDADIQAVQQALDSLVAIDYPASWATDTQGPLTQAQEQADRTQSAYVKDVFWPMEELKGDDLPVSALTPDGFTPLGTTALEKRTVAVNVPLWDGDKCVQCTQCSFVCPHAAIRPFVATDQELSGAPEGFDTKPAHHPDLKGLNFRIQVFPEDCVGCGSCVYRCPGHALSLRPLETQLETQKEALEFCQGSISLKTDLMPTTSVVGTQLQPPLLQFSSCCAGCGETPHVKLLTQIFGDRLIMANATGCSSIWGAYMPAIPYATNAAGHGPAWGNSLFEDNGEYGYGIAKGVKIRRDHLAQCVNSALSQKAFDPETRDLMSTWLSSKDDPDAAYPLGVAIAEKLEPYADGPHPSAASGAAQGLDERSLAAEILDYKEMFGKKSVWAVGGDGWAYDIGYGGLDEVVASGENINVLVLDTEGYSNTGGEMSKATQLGAVTGFTYNGKRTPKKDLGLMLTQYGYVYVAHVSFGADMNQLIQALHEADSYDGPSVVIALCPCISWQIEGGMSSVTGIMREATQTGYWPLWRFDPRRSAQGEDPLMIDSPAPSKPLKPFLAKMRRYESLADREPQLSGRLQSELAKDSDAVYRHLSGLVDMYGSQDKGEVQ